MAIFLTDYVGRRPLIITGAALLVLFNCLIAGFGTKLPHTDTANNVVVASFVMMLWSTKISWATHCCASLMLPSNLTSSDRTKHADKRRSHWLRIGWYADAQEE